MSLLEVLALDQGGGDPLIAKHLHDDEIDLGQCRQTEGGRFEQACQEEKNPRRDESEAPALAHRPQAGQEGGTFHGHKGGIILGSRLCFSALLKLRAGAEGDVPRQPAAHLGNSQTKQPRRQITFCEESAESAILPENHLPTSDTHLQT